MFAITNADIVDSKTSALMTLNGNTYNSTSSFLHTYSSVNEIDDLFNKKIKQNKNNDYLRSNS